MKKLFVYLFILILTISTTSLFAGCNKNTDKNIYIYTIAPWYDEMQSFTPSSNAIELPTGITNDAMLLTTVAENLANSLQNCFYKDEFNFKNAVLTKDVFEKMGANQIILFQGHGSYIDNVGSVLWNKNWWDFSKEEDEEFKKMMQDGLIVNAEFNEAYTAKYIKKYCHNLNGSIIYLGQCLSCKDSILAQAFLDKGAVAVIGNTDAVQTRYGNIMQYEIINNLWQINPLTQNHYTIIEAIAKAESIYGENDSVKYPFATGSKVVVFGNGDYKISMPNK